MAVSPAELETKLNLKSMNLLIVDGDEFSRTLTSNVCTGFRFNKILTAANATTALDHLAANEAQLMLADWLLEEETAESLIKGVRRVLTVRNPFVPIIVLSGTNARSAVAGARDAGANEFMVRPFDLNQLLQRFAQVLLTPRAFIRVESYIGPDRRRRQMPFPEPDRRISNRVSSFRPPSTTAAAAKAAEAGGTSLRAMATVGEKIVVAEEERYRAVRRQDLDDLTALFEQLRQSATPDPAIAEQIHHKSLALKSMGQTFGFPLLTEAGDSLCRMVWQLPAPRMLAPLTIQGIGAHVQTMKLIVEQDIRNDGGDIGRQLVESLRRLVIHAADATAPY